jgi:predicted phage terminase large subunit-like protein
VPEAPELTDHQIDVVMSKRHLLPFVQLTKPDYVADRFHVELCNIVEEFHRRVQRKESPRTIIVSHPQSGKSQIVSRQYPSWAMGLNPEYCLIGSSYNQDWANGLCGDIQRIMDTEEYHEVFPNSFIPPRGSGLGARRSDYFELVGLGGRYKAAGRGAAPAGRPAHVLIIDDFLKGADEAMSETIREAAWQSYVQDLRPRVQRGGGILMMFTRWHLDDPIGRALDNAAKGGEKWDVHVFPAIAQEDGKDWRKKGEALAPSRFNETDLAAIKSVLPAAAWAALYEGDPIPLTGNILPRDKWKYYGGPGQPAFPDMRQFDVFVSTWDASFKDTMGSDFCCGQVWGVRGAEFWLLLNGYIFEQMSYTAFKQAIRQQSYEHPYISFKLIEETANGVAVINELQSELGGITAINPSGGKIARAWAASADLCAGNCYLPDPSIAPWVGAFVTRCSRFPGDLGKSGTDDDIDAWTQMVNHMRLHTHPLIEIWKEQFEKRREAEAKAKEELAAFPESSAPETIVAVPETVAAPGETVPIKIETKPRESATRENPAIVRELAQAQKVAAARSGIFGAEKFTDVNKVTTSTLVKPATNPKTPRCPQCGGLMSKYGDVEVCNNCRGKKQG